LATLPSTRSPVTATTSASELVDGIDDALQVVTLDRRADVEVADLGDAKALQRGVAGRAGARRPS
jgi:hypothetical protein